MKKSFLIIAALALIALLVTSVAPSVSAHPGGTDGNGGHHNRSTGEYHYHHGYPEHDHYDMDGDGEIDCPYDFKDKTENNSRSTPASSEPASKETSKPKSNSSVWSWILAFGLYFLFMFGIPFILS